MAVTRWGLHPGQPTWWLLTLTYAGRVFRFAQAELDVADVATGATYHYENAIVGSVVYQQAWDFGSLTTAASTVPLELMFPVDVAQLVAEGHDLGAATAELAKWIEGSDYEARRVLLVGRVRDPEWGEDGIPVKCSLEASSWEDSGQVPARSQAIDSATTMLYQLGQADKNRPYPIVIGRPGYFPHEAALGAEKGWIPGSQALWFQRVQDPTSGTPPTVWDSCSILLCAGHARSDYAYLSCDADPDGKLVRIRKVYDNLGQPVTMVRSGQGIDTIETYEVPAGETAYAGLMHADLGDYLPDPGSLENSAAIFVSWYDPEERLDGNEWGGPDFRGASPRGAADAIEYLLGFSSERVDTSSIRAQSSLLNRFKIDAVIDAVVTPWEWIRDNILPILPVSLVTGPSGISLLSWNPAATAEDAIAVIDSAVDPQVEFAQSMRSDTSKIRNSYTMKFALDVRTNEYHGKVSVAPLAEAEFASVFFQEEVASAGDAPNAIFLQATASDMSGWLFEIWEDANPETIIDYPTERRTSYKIQNGGAQPTWQQLADRINANSDRLTAKLVQGTGVNQVFIADYNTFGKPGVEGYTFALQSKRLQAIPSRWAHLSRMRYKGVLSETGIFHEEITSAVIYDETTAYAVLESLIQANAFAKVTVEAMLPEDAWDWLERGNVVLLRHAPLHLVNRVARVQQIDHQDDGFVAIRFLLIENPDLDSRYGV